MPFLFAYVCDLLEKLEEPFLREVGALPGTLREYLRKHTSHWFMRHCARLDAFATDDKAVLSMLRPHHQIDRVYGIDSESLELVVARALSVSRLQYLELQKWRTDPLKRDLAFFVHQVMKDSKMTAPSAQSNKVTAEDIDQVLLQIASYHPDSSPEVQSLAETWPDADHVSLLGDLYRGLQPREAKWLTRMVMKSLGPLKFPDDLELSASSGHSHLPQCLQVSIKLQTDSVGAVRREGAMIVRGNAMIPNCSTSLGASVSAGSVSNLLLPTTPASSGAAKFKVFKKTTVSTSPAGLVFLSTPPTSSPAAPTCRAREPPSDDSSVTRSSFALVSTAAKHFPLTPSPAAPPSAIGRSAQLRKSSLHISEPIFSTTGKGATPTNPRRPSRPVLGELSSNAISNSQLNSQSQSSSQKLSPRFIKGSGICQLSANTCPLKHYIFILSPCVATDSYIRDSLLRWHGVHYLTSLSLPNLPNLPRRCPETGKRYRKIVLVESNATKTTAKFLKQVGRLELKRDGKKEWLTVYDWRLLESLGKADQGKLLSHDPWVRMFIGQI